MSGLEINTKKLCEIYKEWRGNESCYDNGRPVFEADELLDFAQFCLKHEANVLPMGEWQSNIPDVIKSLPEIDIDKAEALAISTDYYTFAVGEEVNTADAGAFFLEGYEYARRLSGSVL